MRRKLASLLAAAVLSACGMPVWAQQGPISAGLGLPGAPPGAPAAAACAGPGCGPMTGDDCCATGYFTGGAGVYFITPFFSNNNTGVVTESFTPNKTGGFNATQVNYSSHMNAAPQLWLGYTWDNGWGVRGRWFDFIGTTSSVSGYDPGGEVFSYNIETDLGPGQKFISTRSLHVDTFDLEATNNFVWGRWAMLASFGVRYAHVSSALTSSYIDTDGSSIANVASGSTFSGFGPTMALEARRRIADSDFFLYGSGRGSILAGTLHQTQSFTGFDDDGGVVPAQRDPGVTDYLTSRSTTIMGIGEIELGVEWARVVGRVRLFAQLAFIGQIWVGGAQNNNSLFGEDDIGLFNQGANNFGFLGGVFRAGVSF